MSGQKREACGCRTRTVLVSPETNAYCACHIEDSHSYSVQDFCILRYAQCILVQYIDTKVSDELEASILVADQEVGLI